MSSRLVIVLALALLPGRASAFLNLVESNAFRIVSAGAEIGSALFLEAEVFVFEGCHQAHHLRVDVLDQSLVSAQVPFGPVQRLEVAIIDDGPLEGVFCDQLSQARFRLPIGELLGPRVEVSASITDRVFEDGTEQLRTSELFDGALLLDRPLVPVVRPADPTVLDDVGVTLNTNSVCILEAEDPLLLRIWADGLGDSNCHGEWRLEQVGLGRLAAGTRIQVQTSHTTDSVRYLTLEQGLEQPPSEFQDLLPAEVSHSVPPAASGSWYDPENPGRGLNVQVLSDQRLIAYWFTFDPDGRQAWIFGDGRVLPPAGKTHEVTVRFDALLVTGGVFGPGFDPDSVGLTPWGEFDLVFSACDSALHEWRPALAGWPAGNGPLRQLAGVGDVDCAQREPVQDSTRSTHR